MIRSVIYDWGGVICVNPAEAFVNVCSEALGTTPELLRPLLEHHLDAFQKGSISEEAVWTSVCSKLSLTNYDPAQPLWHPAFKGFYRPQQEVIDSAIALKSEGFSIGFLTNTEKPAMEFNFTLGYDFFDARVYSCAEGIIKPGPDIYLLMAERLGVLPHECIMVDDKEENIRGAEAVGMQGIVFTSFNEYEIELQQLLTATYT